MTQDKSLYIPPVLAAQAEKRLMAYFDMTFTLHHYDASRFRKSARVLIDLVNQPGLNAIILNGKGANQSLALAVSVKHHIHGSIRWNLSTDVFERFPTASLLRLGVDLGALVDAEDNVRAWLIPFAGLSENMLKERESWTTTPELSPQDHADLELGQLLRRMKNNLGL